MSSQHACDNDDRDQTTAETFTLPLTGTFETQRVPNIAIEIIIAGQEKATRFGEGDRGDAADDVVVRIHAHFLIGSDVEQTARGIVGSRRECRSIWKELRVIEMKNERRTNPSTYRYGIDVRFMTGKCLFTHAFSDVPKLMEETQQG